MTINISKIRSVAPNATAVEDASISRSKPDTLEEARIKVVSKLKLNIAYVQNDMKLPKNKRLDLVFKRAANDTYAVGAKYGNRWLQNLFGDDNKFADDIKRSELVAVMNALVEAIESGEADDSIEAIQKQNLEAHSKAA